MRAACRAGQGPGPPAVCQVVQIVFAAIGFNARHDADAGWSLKLLFSASEQRLRITDRARAMEC
eukprot:9173502-Alexandrium_andersonii.AAC.1